MARIANEEIQRLKREVSVEQVCQRYGIALTPQGTNLIGHCPWHQDKTPSFVVTPAKNLWHCLGACDEGGDVLSLVMKAEQVSFRHADAIVQDLAGSRPPCPTVTTRSGTRHAILVDADDSLTDAGLLQHVVNFYHHTYLTDPRAQAYLARRGCGSPDAGTQFRIGYANRTLGYCIPGSTVSGKRLKTRLQHLGVIRRSGHEHLSGSVVFPIHDLSGQVVQLYGRKLTPGLRTGTPAHLYLAGPLRGVWNLEGLIRQHTWVLCEAILDALSLWCHGVRAVTCCFGANTFPEELWTLLRQARPQRVLIAFDGDEPGQQAAEKLTPRLVAEGVTVQRVPLPQGQDLNDVICALMQQDPAAIPRILQGLLADAPILGRPDASRAALAAPVPDNGRASPSSAGRQVRRPESAPFSALAAPLAASVRAERDEESPRTAAPMSPTGSPPAPAPTPAVVPFECKGEDLLFTFGERGYRVRGLSKNTVAEILKVNLRVMRGTRYHIDTLDLYQARARQAFLKAAAAELQIASDTLKRDLGQIVLQVEAWQEEQVRAALEPEEPAPCMSDQERAEALALLTDPTLFTRIERDFEACGFVGERQNRVLGYLAATSRRMPDPLAILVQSHSAAGKTALMQAVLSFMPEEERVEYTAMTGQALFYLTETDLRHKILAIAEDRGAEQATYPLKLLQSEQELRIASTCRDASGAFVTQTYHVQGPVMVFLTSTAIDLDEELVNRCIVLTVDETRAQTRRIHQQQRVNETAEGLFLEERRQRVSRLHQNAQRLLRPLAVVNPYAPRLSFPDHCLRTRREHQKYLVLIRTIALLHQYQRPVKPRREHGTIKEYLEVTPEDVALANQLATEILGRSLDDLPPQTRRLLLLIHRMVCTACEQRGLAQENYRFTRRMIREYSGWGQTQLKVHLKRLEELEYLLIHRGGRGQQLVYELLYHGQGQDGSLFFPGLLDVESLRRGAQDTANTPPSTPGSDQPNTLNTGYDEPRSGETATQSGASRGQVGGKSGGCRPGVGGQKTLESTDIPSDSAA